VLALAAFAAAEETAECKWSWYKLGCVPKPQCVHKMKIRWGKLGDCVLAEPAVAPSEAAPAEAAAESPAVEETPAVEESPAAEASSEEESSEEAPAEKDEA